MDIDPSQAPQPPETETDVRLDAAEVVLSSVFIEPVTDSEVTSSVAADSFGRRLRRRILPFGRGTMNKPADTLTWEESDGLNFN